MGTSGTVGMKHDDGTVDRIYVNFDSFPNQLGEVLRKHYTDPRKVRRLMALGDCSSIDAELEPPSGMAHSWQHPFPNVTVAYHRDRGEPWEDVQTRTDSDEETYWNSLTGYFGYLYKDGEWWWMKNNMDATPAKL